MLRTTAILSIVLASACGPHLLKGPLIAPEAEILDNKLNRELVGLIERYRKAMERRDIPALMEMAGPNYYERAATPGNDDDYGYKGLKKVLRKRFSKLEMLRMKVEVDRIQIKGMRAAVFYTYQGRFLIAGKKKRVWREKRWESELQLERVRNRWMIVGGM